MNELKANPAIGDTAYLVAYMRSGTDIPYSKEIARYVNAEDFCKDKFGEHRLQVARALAPIVELRFKALTAAVYRYATGTIFEVAAGLSPRGMIMTEDNEVFYLDTDQASVELIKFELVWNELNMCRKNHRIQPHNALDPFDPEESGIHGNISVIHEGLLPYFDTRKRRLFAENTVALMRTNGGVWITPDIHTKDSVAKIMKLDPAIRTMVEAMTGIVGENIIDNFFADIAEAQAFFESVGCSVERVKALELCPKLSLPVNVQIRPRLEAMEVWVMRLK